MKKKLNSYQSVLIAMGLTLGCNSPSSSDPEAPAPGAEETASSEGESPGEDSDNPAAESGEEADGDGPEGPDGPQPKGSRAGSLSLSLGFEGSAEGFRNGLPESLTSGSYNIANDTINVPSSQDLFNATQPGGLALSNVGGLSLTCTGAPLPDAISNLPEGNMGGTTEEREQYQLKYTLEGIWSRFYGDCGPTNIPFGLAKVDEIFNQLETNYNEGESRCLKAPHYLFDAKVEDKPGLQTPAQAWLSCAEDERANWEGSVRAYGQYENNWYYWDLATNGSLVKISDDGNSMETYYNVGTSGGSGSQLISYARSVNDTENDQQYFYMSMTGHNIGPGGCQGTIISKTDSDAGTDDYIYFKLIAPQPGNEKTDCADGQTNTIEYCLNAEDFSLASDVNDCLTASELEGTPLEGSTVLKQPDVTPDEATGYIKSAVNADGKLLSDLASTRTKDPLLVLKGRIFDSGPTSLQSSLLPAYERNMETIARITEERTPVCLLDIPKVVNMTSVLGQGDPIDLGFPVQLSCYHEQNDSREDLVYGYANDKYQVIAKASAGDNTNRIISQADSEGRGEFWMFSASPDLGTDFDNTGGMALNMKVDPTRESYEFALMGGNNGVFELGCGIQFKQFGNFIYAQGRFAGENCEDVFFDQDCIEVLEGELFRRPVETCQTESEAGLLELEPLTRAFASPERLKDMVFGFATPAEIAGDELNFGAGGESGSEGFGGPDAGQEHESGEGEHSEGEHSEGEHDSDEFGEASDSASVSSEEELELPPILEAAEEFTDGSATLEKVELIPLTPASKKLTVVFHRQEETLGANSLNCKISSTATLGDNNKDISALWEFPLSALNDTEYSNLELANADGAVLFSYNFTVATSLFKDATVSQSTQVTLEVVAGDGSVQGSVALDTHTEGSYLGSNFFPAEISPDMKIRARLSGTTTVTCPDLTYQHQGMIRVGFKDLTLRY